MLGDCTLSRACALSVDTLGLSPELVSTLLTAGMSKLGDFAVAPKLKSAKLPRKPSMCCVLRASFCLSSSNSILTLSRRGW